MTDQWAKSQKPGSLAAISIRPLAMTDYAAIATLLQGTSGVTFKAADDYAATERYLLRNPGLSFVAVVDGAIVGLVMAGHDGRRGYLQHLVVQPQHRGRGLARQLVDRCLTALAQVGIAKTHLFVLQDNEDAHGFWRSLGWQVRDDVVMYSYNRSSNPNI